MGVNELDGGKKNLQEIIGASELLEMQGNGRMTRTEKKKKPPPCLRMKAMAVFGRCLEYSQC